MIRWTRRARELLRDALDCFATARLIPRVLRLIKTQGGQDVLVCWKGVRFYSNAERATILVGMTSRDANFLPCLFAARIIHARLWTVFLEHSGVILKRRGHGGERAQLQ